MKSKLLLLTAALGLVSITSRAQITYDFTGKAGIFDGLASQTVTIAPGLDMTLTATGGNLNSNSSTFGIDATGSGDSASEIDQLEVLEITFNQNIDFISIDLNAVGSDLSDGAKLTLGSNSEIDLINGTTPNFNSNDVYTPSSPVTITTLQSIRLESSTPASSEYYLQNITVIPEPSSLALIGLTALAALGILRNRK